MENSIPMNKLCPGEGGTVDSMHVSAALRGRMRDIGLICGTPVVCVGRSPLGDPAAFRIRGSVIALRGEDCARIFLRR